MPVLFTPEVLQLILYFAVLAIILIVALYVLSIFRDNSLQKELKPEEMLNKLQKLETEGKLSPEEFRIIKKRLSEHVLYEKHCPCPDLHSVTADSAAILLRGINDHETGNPEDTKLLGKEEEDRNTVKTAKKE